MPSIGSISSSEMSQPSTSQYTPLSTGQEGTDIEVELMERRYKKAVDLMGQQKFGEAVPHLRGTLNALKGSNEGLVFESAPRREEVQLLLAKAFSKNDPKCEEAESILREVYKSPESKPLERFSAAHFLAQLLANLHPQDCSEAKLICLTAVKGRNTTLGRADPKTYESIALLASICQISNDSDREIWQDMLPDNYELPKTSGLGQRPSPWSTAAAGGGSAFGQTSILGMRSGGIFGSGQSGGEFAGAGKSAASAPAAAPTSGGFAAFANKGGFAAAASQAPSSSIFGSGGL